MALKTGRPGDRPHPGKQHFFENGENRPFLKKITGGRQSKNNYTCYSMAVNQKTITHVTQSFHFTDGSNHY
jgi:hypothetical protein